MIASGCIFMYRGIRNVVERACETGWGCLSRDLVALRSDRYFRYEQWYWKPHFPVGWVQVFVFSITVFTYLSLIDWVL